MTFNNYPALIKATAYCMNKNIPIPPELMLDLLRLGFKSYEYFLATLSRMVRNVYEGRVAGEFIGMLQDLILGQISNSFETAWTDDGNELPPPEYLRDASQAMVREQWAFVEDFYRAIVDARIDQTPIDPLLTRAEMWASQWNSGYNEARRLMAVENGDKLIWVMGSTEHCDTCLALNGIVAYAKEWEQAGAHPGQPKNDLLICGGWNCACSLEVTDKRRSANALTRILDIVTAGHV